MKRLLAIIGCSFLLALVCIQLYSRYVDPDLQFFLRAAKVSDAWAEQIHAAERSIYVLAGGSEARSGVDPQIMLDEFGIPLVNAAGAAGFGLQANAAAAFKYLKPGDTLVLSLLSTNDLNVPPSSSGIKMGAYRQGLSVFDSGMIEPSLETAGKLLSSDVRAMFILATRYFGHNGRLFKYDEQTVIHPSGWMDIRYREMDSYEPKALEAPARLVPLAADSLVMQSLRRLHSYCQTHSIRLFVSIPASCIHESGRAKHAMTALCITRQGIPVLKDERLGCLPASTDFADMENHLNAGGAAENSRILARLLQNNDCWTTEELEETMHAMGWNADGTPIIENPVQYDEIPQAHP